MYLVLLQERLTHQTKMLSKYSISIFTKLLTYFTSAQSCQDLIWVLIENQYSNQHGYDFYPSDGHVINTQQWAYATNLSVKKRVKQYYVLAGIPFPLPSHTHCITLYLPLQMPYIQAVSYCNLCNKPLLYFKPPSLLSLFPLKGNHG